MPSPPASADNVGLSRAAILVWAFIAILVLRLMPDHVRFSPETDPQDSLLSTHLVDTEFLARCAVQHKGLISQTELLAPEIRIAVLKLVNASPAID